MKQIIIDEETNKFLDNLKQEALTFGLWLDEASNRMVGSRVTWKIEFVESNAEDTDWIFRLLPDESTVEFNIDLLLHCNCDRALFRIVVLHELVHFFLQQFDSKEQGRRVKSGLGETSVQRADVQADVIAFHYLRERHGMDSAKKKVKQAR